MKVAIATCRDHPHLDRSDAILRHGLERRGATVVALPWNTTTQVALNGVDAVIVRAVWDYPKYEASFRAWLSGLAARDCLMVMNPVSLLNWNLDKRYLLDLSSKGFRVPATTVLNGSIDGAAEAMERLSIEDAVVKPSVGCDGFGVIRVNRDTATKKVSKLRSRIGARTLIVQELLPEIEQGEFSIVFVGGRYAHTAITFPQSGEFRINTRFRPIGPMRTEPPPSLIADAQQIINALPVRPLYARVDGVNRGGRFVCLELELIEPSLFMFLAPRTADTLAEQAMTNLRRPI